MELAFDIKAWFAARDGSRQEFIRNIGWDDAVISPVSEDCAMRRYLRLVKPDGQKAILLESLPDDDPHSTPGHKLRDTIRIGSYLRTIDIHTPEIYEVDEANGYLLIEDFGDYTFKNAFESGTASRHDLYDMATRVLVHLRENADLSKISLPSYYDSIIHSDRQNVLAWYAKAQSGMSVTDDLLGSFNQAWTDVMSGLPDVPQGFLHVDYHFENLMWLPGHDGIQACGVIDFQQAKAGPAPYDLTNLLNDARTIVPADIKAHCYDLYTQGMSAEDKEAFDAWFLILSAEFHCRVIGLFVRMALRDGKFGYLPHLPRLAAYLRDELRHPALKPLNEWFDAHGISFAENEIPQIKHGS